MKTLIKTIRLFFCLKTPEKELPLDTSEVKVNRRKGIIWINNKRIYTDPNGRKVCEQLLTKAEIKKIKEMNLI